VLQERFPAWKEGLVRSGQWAAEAQLLLSELAQQDLKIIEAASAEGNTSEHASDLAWLPGKRSAYGGLSDPRLRNVLRVLVMQRGAPAPPAPRLIEWIRQLQTAGSDRVPMMIWQNWVLRCWDERLWLEKRVMDLESRDELQGIEIPSLRWTGDQPFHAQWRGVGEFDLVWTEGSTQEEGASGMKLPQVLRHDCGPLCIQTASGGDSIQPSALQPHRTLRKLFQEKRVPPWRRGRIPMLHCGRTLIAVPGIAVDPNWQAPAGSPGWQLIWRDAGLACYNN
jgi:tRNA(Ile)-lysidine synthase